jgi:hypothetical protein
MAKHWTKIPYMAAMLLVTLTTMFNYALASPSSCASGETLATANSGGGCTLDDMLFSNFTSTSTANGSNSINSISMFNISDGSDFGNALFDAGLSFIGSDFSAVSAGTISASVDFLTQANEAPPAPTSGGNAWSFEYLTQSTGVTMQIGDTVTIESEYGLGATSAVGVGNSFFASCATADQASVTTVLTDPSGTVEESSTEMLGGSSSSGILVGIPFDVFSMAMRLAVTVDSVSGSTSGADTPFFDQDAVTVADTPEPSTILLTGAALIFLLAFLGRTSTRRHKCGLGAALDQRDAGNHSQ